MGDISDLIPKESQTVSAIYDHYKKAGDRGFLSRTLSVSLLGRPCERFLWYSYRQCVKPDFPGRMYRLFDRGNIEEGRLTADLRNIGCTVHDIDERTGKQFLVTAFGGHLKGYMDSCILGVPEAPKTWHVGEYKTHNAKSWKKVVKDGLKEAKPEHYAQVMIEMKLTEMKRALYLAVNKDTDEIYSERVSYDKKEALCLAEKARRIIEATAPPDRISDRSDFWVCKFCDAKALCFPNDCETPVLPIPSLSCRQCCHATPITEGEGKALWSCRRTGVGCPEKEICDGHLVLPGLIYFAEPTDHGTDEDGTEWIEFTNRDGGKWRHGKAASYVDSKELMVLTPVALMSDVFNTAKNLFGAKAKDCYKSITTRYPEEDCRIPWRGKPEDLLDAWKEMYDEDLRTLEPVTTQRTTEYDAVERTGGRVAIVWKMPRPILKQQAEIRVGVE
ncbi:MAG: hypothetical protein GY906_23915 [bacterium]|nr:hypothetical protein [bacterium]